MSEKIYALLLRLYPAHFRQSYGDEALQLFRDRARDEEGFLFGLRLWLDLLSDLAISVPREYRSIPGAIAAGSAPGFWDGTPSFHILEDETLSFGSLLYGGIVTLAVYGLILFMMGHRIGHLRVVHQGGEQSSRYSATGARLTPTVAEPTLEAAKATPKILLSYSSTRQGARPIVSLTATVSAVVTGPTPTGNVRFLDGT